VKRDMKACSSTAACILVCDADPVDKFRSALLTANARARSVGLSMLCDALFTLRSQSSRASIETNVRQTLDVIDADWKAIGIGDTKVHPNSCRPPSARILAHVIDDKGAKAMLVTALMVYAEKTANPTYAHDAMRLAAQVAGCDAVVLEHAGDCGKLTGCVIGGDA
jgi:hypothetical protein